MLSAIFTTALNDQVIFLHPCKGVKTPTVPVRPPAIISPEQFDQIYSALPEGDFRLLVEVDIESGLRWGELTELRAKDIDLGTRILTVSRAVVQVNPKFHPDGKRFLVKQYPKDKEYRRFKLGADVMSHTTCVFGVSSVSGRLADLPVRLATVVCVSCRLPRPDQSR